MKKIITVILVLMLLLISGTTALAKDNGKITGFDDNGYNYNGGLYKGFVLPNVYLIQNWSKEWTGQPSDPSGAYCKCQYTWYSNDYLPETKFGMFTMTTFEEGRYKITDFVKLMKVSDNAEMWAKYFAAGAGDALMGNYASGVPMFIGFQEVVTVYDTTTNQTVLTIEAPIDIRKGLGKPLF